MQKCTQRFVTIGTSCWKISVRNSNFFGGRATQEILLPEARRQDGFSKANGIGSWLFLGHDRLPWLWGFSGTVCVGRHRPCSQILPPPKFCRLRQVARVTLMVGPAGWGGTSERKGEPMSRPRGKRAHGKEEKYVKVDKHRECSQIQVYRQRLRGKSSNPRH